MGVNLIRFDDGEEWTCNNSLWSFILESAIKEGWKPQGTYKFVEGTESLNNNWNKNDYQSNQGQGVTEEDIENMILSLKQYLNKQDSKNPIESDIIKSFINFVQSNEGIHAFEIY